MLTAQKMQYIELRLSQPTLSNQEIAEIIGVTRQATWNWSKDAEVKAELDRRLQAGTQNAILHLRTQTNKLVNEMLDLALNPNTEQRTRNSALQYLLDRVIGKATDRIDIEVSTDNDAPDIIMDFQRFLDNTQSGDAESNSKDRKDK